MNCVRRVRSLLGGVGAVIAALGCGSAPSAPPLSLAANTELALRSLDRAQFVWVSTECVDGGSDLARGGFERRLTTELHGESLRFTYDTQLPLSGCVSSEVWSLAPAAGGQWDFSPEAVVTLPKCAGCGAQVAKERGVLRMTGDTLQELRFSSAWCRGYDARFTYRRVPPRALATEELLRRYVAHWNRRDADAVAALFAEDGVLLEPFSKSDDGTPVRHEGRAAVRAYLRQAFASVPWLGLSLDELQAAGAAIDTDTGTDSAWVATWSYMDPRLAEPLRGRNLFVIAGHEIYSAELQLLRDPVPLRAPPVSP